MESDHATCPCDSSILIDSPNDPFCFHSTVPETLGLIHLLLGQILCDSILFCLITKLNVIHFQSISNLFALRWIRSEVTHKNTKLTIHSGIWWRLNREVRGDDQRRKDEEMMK